MALISERCGSLMDLAYLKKSNWLQVLQSASAETNSVVQDTRVYKELGRQTRGGIIEL